MSINWTNTDTKNVHIVNAGGLLNKTQLPWTNTFQLLLTERRDIAWTTLANVYRKFNVFLPIMY